MGSSHVIDHSPFLGLVHVTQIGDEAHSNSSCYNSDTANVVFKENVVPVSVCSQSLELGCVTSALEPAHDFISSLASSIPLQASLDCLQSQYPQHKVRDLFNRYKNLRAGVVEWVENATEQYRLLKQKQEELIRGKQVLKSAREKIVTIESSPECRSPLICSIFVERPKKKKQEAFRVDESKYCTSKENSPKEEDVGRPRRRSYRLAQKRLREASYEDKSDTDEDEEELSPPRKRGCRRHPSDDDVHVIGKSRVEAISSEEDIKILPNVSCQLGHELWSDTYQPKKASDVIGNTRGVKELYSWLEQWREKCLNTPGDMGGDSHTHSNPSLECSFDSTGSSANSDDGNLLSAIFVTGPVGVGKTATIYGIALELGFKVFEVNTTHIRSRASLLAMLREATQSHQVVIQNAPDVVQKPKTAAPPPSNGLYSFFKPTAPKVSKPVAKQETTTVALATTTLILLEEVSLFVGYY